MLRLLSPAVRPAVTASLLLLAACRAEDPLAVGLIGVPADTASTATLTTSGAALELGMPWLGTSARFDRSGARIADGAFALRTTGFGRVGVTVPVPEADVLAGRTASGAPRVDRVAGPIREWWTTASPGLEQGWDVATAPEGRGSLVVQVDVDGAAVDAQGEDLAFTARDGRVWRYGGAHAEDADGTPLPVSLVATTEGFEVHVDDAGARYPVAIDPVLATASVSLSGEAVHDYFGAGLAGVGDVNADGYGDVLVGAYEHDSNQGRAYLYLGGSAGISSTSDNVFEEPGTYPPSFGSVVHELGDLNGDGYADFGVYAGGYVGTGDLYVFYGSSGTPDNTADWHGTGEGTTDYYGYAACAADLNDDGYDDLVVGSRGIDTQTGRVYVYAGSATGPATTPTLTMDGYAENSYFGVSLSCGGDVNGDGVADLLVGADHANSAQGQVFLFTGDTSTLLDTTAASTLDGEAGTSFFGNSIAILGDEDGDGHADVVVGAYQYAGSIGRAYLYRGSSSGLSATADEVWEGETSGNYFGQQVAAAGDINGDGYADLAVGAYGYSSSTGRVYVYEGSASGISAAPTATIDSPVVGAYFGRMVAGTGDTDGDGFGDLVVGAPLTNSATGAAYVFLGYRDDDGDGSPSTVDCDDLDANSYPGAPEIAGDEVDEDCDTIEVCFVDADADGYRPDDSTTVRSADIDCTGAGEARASDPSDDCNDADATVSPGSPELGGDGIDEDCNGLEICYLDVDDDLYHGDASVETADFACSTAPEVRDTVPGGDCNDNDPNINPGAAEIPADSIDEDCDGGELCFEDADSDGYLPDDYGTVASTNGSCTDPGEGSTTSATGDCDDADATTYPGAPETDCGDPTDHNCDGTVNFIDADSDGAASCVDCDDANPAIYPGATEACDGFDNNCDGVADGEDAEDAPVWYADADGDGYPDQDVTKAACSAPNGYIADATAWDCDDGDANVHPGATDAGGDGLDQDCDGSDNPAGEGKDGTGCGCATTADPSTGLLALALGLAAVGARRRR